MQVWFKYCFFVTFLITSGISLFGQTACFTVDKQRGCAPLSINVSDCSGSGVIVYYYEFEDFTSPNKSDTFHTYTEPGLYKCVQLIQNAGSDTTLKLIEVLASPAPKFDLSICEDSTVYIQATDTTYEQYFIDFGDGFMDTLVLDSISSHKYSSGPNQSITVQGNYVPGNCGGDATININLFSQLEKPDLQNVIALTRDSVLLKFSSQLHVNYEIAVSVNDTSSFVPVDTLNSKSTMNTIIVRSTYSQQRCFRVKAFDRCGNSTTSNVICLISPDISSKINYNEITWSSYPGNSFQNFELYKDSSLFGNYMVNNTYTLNDSAIFCGKESCYYLITNVTGNRFSQSKDSCVIGNADRIEGTVLLNSSYTSNNTILLHWDTPPILYSDFSILQDDQELSKVTDTLATLNNNGCFTVRINDICGNESNNSNETCPILLNATTDKENSNIIHLNWSLYKGYGWSASNTQYTVQLIDSKDSVLEAYTISTPGSYDAPVNYSFNQQNLLYRVQAQNTDTNLNQQVTYSNTEQIQVINQVFAPNAFSPNGDNLNDIFLVKSRFSTGFLCKIFDRWNNVVFETTNIKTGWDGKYPDGSNAPPGIYTYYYEVIDQNEEVSKRSGILTLIR